MTDKRFQVFVSSTYTDLIEERQQVSEQLLRSRCIPSGMELFTASGRPPWDVIKSAIDTTDYMILILAGRYGSVGTDGVSFTEREYDYATSLGIPVLVFLHEDPDMLPRKHVDVGEQAEKLDGFRVKVSDSEHRTVQFWGDARDLAQKVSTAIAEAIRSEPRPGWVRGGTETDQEGDRQAPVALQPASTSDELREVLNAPGGVARVERVISDAARPVTSIPFFQGRGEFNTVTDIQAEHFQRLTTLEDAARPLGRCVAAASRWGSSDLDWHWHDLITELSRAPRLSDKGYTGAGLGIHVPIKRQPDGPLHTDNRCYNQVITALRAPTERGNALLGRWRALDRVTLCPQRIGAIEPFPVADGWVVREDTPTAGR